MWMTGKLASLKTEDKEINRWIKLSQMTVWFDDIFQMS